MIDETLYADPRLVALYDLLNTCDIDRDFYLTLPRRVPARILDAGCGTGLLACAYAKAGHTVVGIDPAPRMLDQARSRDGGNLVSWRISTLQAFRTTEPFDLIVMTGHAFQCLVTDEEIIEAFRVVAKSVSGDGRFTFETRNPTARGWEAWTPERSRKASVALDGTGFEVFHQVCEVHDETVLFETVYTIENEPEQLRSRSLLRFAPLPKIEVLASDAGLTVDSVFGDWERSALTESSPEIIVTLRPR